ncbi:MAG: SDR family oxidoreductase [Alphaproteobacteria bacterium]|nr:SDR family oxidoreductase [Alphaproteobacteria bacterium]
MSIHSYQTALVTGASSGIGAACVRMLSRHDMRVTAMDRDSDRLAELASETGCEAIVMDIRQTEELYETFADRDIDVLVNNAGLAHGLAEGFLGTGNDQVDEMIGVNVTAAIHVLRAVLPSMITRKRGHIIAMGSIASLYPLGLPVYGASKGAIRSLSRHLRMELSGTKIRHTEICPGRTETGFFDTAFGDPQQRASFVSEIRLLDPADIADAIEYALRTPLHVNVSSIEITPVDQVPGGQILG